MRSNFLQLVQNAIKLVENTLSSYKKAACLTLDWVPNRVACINACLSGDVTRSFRIHVKALQLLTKSNIEVIKST